MPSHLIQNFPLPFPRSQEENALRIVPIVLIKKGNDLTEPLA